MLKFHIIIIKFSIFTNKNSQRDTFFPKLKNTIIKIDIKSFSVQVLEFWIFSSIFFQKHKKCSYFNNFDRVWLVNELVLPFSSPIKYAKAQFNPIILSRIVKSDFYIKPIPFHMTRM